MRLKTLCFILITFTNIVCALDILEPCTQEEMVKSYQKFQQRLQQIKDKKYRVEEGEKNRKFLKKMILNDLFSTCKTMHDNVVYIKYLRDLVFLRVYDSSNIAYQGKVKYARRLQAALRGLHCGGISLTKKANKDEQNIMIKAAQEVGLTIAPWTIILEDKTIQEKFFNRENAYWCGEAYTGKNPANLPSAVKEHINIVSAITQRTVLEVGLYYKDMLDKNKTPYQQVISYEQDSSYLYNHLPYPQQKDFSLPGQPSKQVLAAKAAIRLISTIRSVAQGMQNIGFEEFQERDKDRISSIITPIETLILEKISSILNPIDILGKPFFELFKETKDKIDVFKKPYKIQVLIQQHLGVRILEQSDSAKKCDVKRFEEIVLKQAKGLTFPEKILIKPFYEMMGYIGEIIFQNTNLSQERVENALFLIMNSQKLINQYMINIFSYLTKEKEYYSKEEKEYYSKEIYCETGYIIESIYYSILYSHDNHTSTICNNILAFLKHFILDNTNNNFSLVNKGAIHKLRDFFNKIDDDTLIVDDLILQTTAEVMLTLAQDKPGGDERLNYLIEKLVDTDYFKEAGNGIKFAQILKEQKQQDAAETVIKLWSSRRLIKQDSSFSGLLGLFHS